MKRCCLCKQTLPLSEYNKHKDRKDGLQTVCRECNRARSRRYYKENPELHKKNVRRRAKQVVADNRRQLMEYLSERSCTDCGITDSVVLEFDHLSDKKHNISSMMRAGYRWLSVLEEIEKCEVVCANCHRKRTYARSGCYRLEYMPV